MEIVSKATVVGIKYVMKIDGKVNGEVANQSPVYFLVGAKNIVAGLEEVLIGKKVGDHVHVKLLPEKAYGFRDESLIERHPIKDWPEKDPPKLGMMVQLEDENEKIVVGVVSAIDDQELTIDFNPPLAGKTLEYSATVLSIRKATPNELKNGLPAEVAAQLT